MYANFFKQEDAWQRQVDDGELADACSFCLQHPPSWLYNEHS
jgi:hypothetical protein